MDHGRIISKKEKGAWLLEAHREGRTWAAVAEDGQEQRDEGTTGSLVVLLRRHRSMDVVQRRYVVVAAEQEEAGDEQEAGDELGLELGIGGLLHEVRR